MSADLTLRNARIVLADEIVSGSVHVKDGRIASIDPGPSTVGEDCHGDYVIPGLVELHTDHLEGHYAPRPKVRWNPKAAVLAHDAQVASAGITTVLDALRVGADDGDELQAEDMTVLAQAITATLAAGQLRADHLIHLRCEVSSADCMPEFERHVENPLVRLASLMDHAPGQRQFTSIDAYAVYYIGKKKMSQAEFDDFCQRRMAQSAANSGPNRSVLTQACRVRGIVLASHDDATLDHVAEALEQGIRVAEFPTTHQAAAASREAGMSVLMGAPNVMRGGSHSGNVSARSLAENGHLDILSSDYIPFSLIQSAFFLSEVVESISLPQSMAMVSKTPAHSVGLDDRGEIAIGKRGDLVRVRLDDHVPVVRGVWREGMRVA